MEDLEYYKEKYLLKTKDDLIYIQPLSQHDYRTYPIIENEPTLLITFEQYIGLHSGGQIKIDEFGNQYQLPKYQFNKFLNGLEPYMEE